MKPRQSLTFIFLILLLILSPQVMGQTVPACVDLGKSCVSKTCCPGLSCQGIMAQSPWAIDDCKLQKETCTENTQCCSGLCLKNPHYSASGVCSMELRCVEVLLPDSPCDPILNGCLNSRCLPVWNKSDLLNNQVNNQVCKRDQIACTQNDQCCSQKCMDNICVPQFKCQSCTPELEDLPEGGKCCEGLKKDVQGKCKKVNFVHNQKLNSNRGLTLSQMGRFVFEWFFPSATAQSKAQLADSCEVSADATKAMIEKNSLMLAIELYLITFEFVNFNSRGNDSWVISTTLGSKSIHEWQRYFAQRLNNLRIKKDEVANKSRKMTLDFCSVVKDPNVFPLANLEATCPTISSIFGIDPVTKKIKVEGDASGVVGNSLGTCLQRNLMVDYQDLRSDIYEFMQQFSEFINGWRNIAWSERSMTSKQQVIDYCHPDHDLLAGLNLYHQEQINDSIYETALSSIKQTLIQKDVLRYQIMGDPALVTCAMGPINASHCTTYTCDSVDFDPNSICSQRVPANYCLQAIYQRTDDTELTWRFQDFPYLIDPIIPSMHPDGQTLIGKMYEFMDLFATGHWENFTFGNQPRNIIVANLKLKFRDGNPFLYNGDEIFQSAAEFAYRWIFLLPSMNDKRIYPTIGMRSHYFLMKKTLGALAQSLFDAEFMIYSNLDYYSKETIFELDNYIKIYKDQLLKDERSYKTHRDYMEQVRVKNMLNITIVNNIKKSGKSGIPPIEMDANQKILEKQWLGWKSLADQMDKSEKEMLSLYPSNGSFIQQDLQKSYETMIKEAQDIVLKYKLLVK